MGIVFHNVSLNLQLTFLDIRKGDNKKAFASYEVISFVKVDKNVLPKYLYKDCQEINLVKI